MITNLNIDKESTLLWTNLIRRKIKAELNFKRSKIYSITSQPVKMCFDAIFNSYFNNKDGSWIRVYVNGIPCDLSKPTTVTNEVVLSEVEKGNVLSFWNTLFSHFAVCIDITEDEIFIMHDPGRKHYTNSSSIQVDSLKLSDQTFLAVYKCKPTVDSNRCRALAVRGAYEVLGENERKYNIFSRNCENTANDIINSGSNNSAQIDMLYSRIFRYMFMLLSMLFISIYPSSCDNTFIYALWIIFAYALSLFLSICFYVVNVTYDVHKTSLSKYEDYLCMVKYVSSVFHNSESISRKNLKNLHKWKTKLLFELIDENDYSSSKPYYDKLKRVISLIDCLIIDYFISCYGLQNLITNDKWDGNINESQIVGIKRLGKYFKNNKALEYADSSMHSISYLLLGYIRTVVEKINHYKSKIKQPYNVQEQRLCLAMLNVLKMIYGASEDTEDIRYTADSLSSEILFMLSNSNGDVCSNPDVDYEVKDEVFLEEKVLDEDLFSIFTSLQKTFEAVIAVRTLRLLMEKIFERFRQIFIEMLWRSAVTDWKAFLTLI